MLHSKATDAYFWDGLSYWVTTINYFAPTLFGSIESCGCFGEILHLSTNRNPIIQICTVKD